MAVTSSQSELILSLSSLLMLTVPVQKRSGSRHLEGIVVTIALSVTLKFLMTISTCSLQVKTIQSSCGTTKHRSLITFCLDIQTSRAVQYSSTTTLSSVARGMERLRLGDMTTEKDITKLKA